MEGEHVVAPKGLPIVVRVGPGSVWVEGELDVATAPTLAGALEAATNGPVARLEVDLGGVTFLGLAGVHALQDARRRQRAKGGDVVLVDVSPIANRVLSLTGWRP